MKLAAKQVELASCPYVSEDSKTQLAESSAPPIRLISLKSNGTEVKAGNETVLFRHEKTFYNKPGIFIQVKDTQSLQDIKEIATQVSQYSVNYVGIELLVDGFAVVSDSGDQGTFKAAVESIRSSSKLPVILVSEDPGVILAGITVLQDETPLISAASSQNWEEMASLAKQNGAALAVTASSLDELADLTEKIKATGIEDLVLQPEVSGMANALAVNTQVRRLSLKKNFKPLGYPLISFTHTPEMAAQAIAKYSGFVVVDHFDPATIYPLLVLRQNIYTDPQKPIQVQPGLYEINSPDENSPLLVTTNFSITYFSVANEVEGSGLPAWLLVTDAEGMSVLTAWAAGKFDSERITKAVKTSNAGDKLAKKRLVLPGHVAVLSGELEGELPDWEIRVGPREAVDLPKFMKQAL